MSSSVMRFSRAWLVWSLVAFPLSPSIFVLLWHGNRCFGPQPPGLAEPPITCLAFMAAFAPLGAVWGTLGKDESAPPNMWPGIVLTTLVIGLIASIVQTACTRKR